MAARDCQQAGEYGAACVPDRRGYLRQFSVADHMVKFRPAVISLLIKNLFALKRTVQVEPPRSG